MAKPTSKTANATPSADEGGAGDRTAGALGGPAVGEFLDASPEYIARIGGMLTAEEAQIRAHYPAWAAAIDAWQAKGSGQLPTGVRVISRVEGFRRAGIAHSAQPTLHPIETFGTPELLEALFAEPNLAVELV